MFRSFSVQTEAGAISVYANKLQEAGPSVILLHGLLSNHTTWNVALEALESHGINAYAPDLRGHGTSDMRKTSSLYTFEKAAEDIIKLIEQEGLKKPFLVGYSYGGPIACLVAAKKKNSGVFLVSSNMRSPLLGTPLAIFNGLAYWLLRVTAWLVRPQFRRRYHYYQYSEATSYWQTVWTGFNTMPLAINFWMLSQMLKLNLESVLPKIAAPALLLHSLHDPFLSEQEVASMIVLLPKATSLVPEHGSHFIASRDQEGTVAALINFIQIYADRPF